MKTAMIRPLLFSFFLVSALTAATSAQVKSAFAEVEIGDSLSVITEKLKDKCKKQYVVSRKSPSFPLALESEKHLICHGLAIGESLIERVAFTIADEKLVFISAKGNAAEALSKKTNSKELQYVGLRVFRDELAFADENTDTFTILSKDALHPNLFVWKNPYLSEDAGFEYAYRTSAARPSFLQFGGMLSKLKPKFEMACPLMTVDENQKVFLPTKPEKQTQINCFGHEYAGFPRKFEAIFGDGKLQMVWILTATPEEARLRTALLAAFGDQIFENDSWVAFDNWKTYLRKDKPEVLMISDELIPYFKPRVTGK